MTLMPGAMPQDYQFMLKLSINIVDDEREASKAEVSWPNFITQGISPRQDGALRASVDRVPRTTPQYFHNLQASAIATAV